MSDATALLTIVGMGAVTYAARVAGAAFLHGRQLGPRATAALDAVPAAVLTAVIAPAVLAAGPAEAVAGAATAIAALRLPLLGALAVGVAAVVAVRALV